MPPSVHTVSMISKVPFFLQSSPRPSRLWYAPVLLSPYTDVNFVSVLEYQPCRFIYIPWFVAWWLKSTVAWQPHWQVQPWHDAYPYSHMLITCQDTLPKGMQHFNYHLLVHITATGMSLQTCIRNLAQVCITSAATGRLGDKRKLHISMSALSCKGC